MNFQGAPVSKGIAAGKAFVYVPFKASVRERRITVDEMEGDIAAYHKAVEGAATELSALQARMAAEDPDKAGIFGAHLEILRDVALEGEILQLIREEEYGAEYAVETVYEKFIELFSTLEEDIFRERCADLKDVKNRILRVWMGAEHKDLSHIEEPAVIFAHDLLPSDTATLNRERVLAIVTEIGGMTSHSAIIARSYEIPALLGITHVMAAVKDGDDVVVDAISGRLVINPSDTEKEEYARKQREYTQHVGDLKKFQSAEPVTRDGRRIDICLNIGSVSEEELSAAVYTDGVGLFRSEFLFMAGKNLPSEEQQFQVYKKAAETFGERQMILRTLDIGGDKTLESMELPVEDNPFLGVRALRLCFERTELFKTQLRAALRASAFGNLAIMFPMVGSLEDWRRAKKVLDDCRQELREEGVVYNENIQVGIMIEIPAAALLADILSQEVDFASVGTNDLCQYLLAADRLNPGVAVYYQSFHPAMFRLIASAAKALSSAGKRLSICGEMGGDPAAALAFIGMGITKLSMGASSVAAVKRMVTRLHTENAERIVKKICEMRTAAEIEAYLSEALEQMNNE